MALRPCKECQKQISTDAKVCPNCGKAIRSSSSSGSGCLLAILILILIGAVGSVVQHQSEHGTASSPTVNPKTPALSQLKFDYRWRKGGFGSVMEADFTLKNNSDHDIKDFEITCEHFAKSGTLIDSNKRTVYDVVKAHATRKFSNFNMGFIHSQADTSSCSVTDLSIAP
jgi:hypothetical protein